MTLMYQRPDFSRGVQRVPYLQTPYPLSDALNELVVDRGLHEQSAGGRAALAVQAVDHEYGGIDRAIQIGIVEHDDRVLASQLQVNPLQCRRALAHDQAAGLRLADEGGGADRGMLGQ